MNLLVNRVFHILLLISAGFFLNTHLAGCQGGKVQRPNLNQGNTYDGIKGAFNKDHSWVAIDLGEKFYKQDSFDCQNFIGFNQIGSDTLRITIKSEEYKVVSAKKVTCYYPTLWSSPEDDAIQFVYLFDLCYEYTQDLQIKDGDILYPSSYNDGLEESKYFFSKITRKQLTASIKNIPKEYKGKTPSMLYGGKHEEKVWLKKVKRYKEGDFTSKVNEPFDINPYDIRLVITFQGKNGSFVKTLKDYVQVGN